MKYCYSHNEEEFHGNCDTITGAISEALDNDPDAEGPIWIGETAKPTIGAILNDHHVENLLEGLQETAGEEYGEYTEGWLDPPRFASRDVKGGETREAYDLRVTEWREKRSERLAPLREHISAALEKWATAEDEQPGFFGVKNTKEYSRAEAEAILATASTQPATLQEPPAPKWYKSHDDRDNTVWEASSPYHDDGAPFVWRLLQRVRDDKHEWYEAHDPELMLMHDEPEAWPTIEAAKAAIAKKHADIIKAEMVTA